MRKNGKIERFLSNRLAAAGALITLLILLLAVLAPAVASDPLKAAPANRLQPPSAEHLFGTDTFGRDLFARVIYGARVSAEVGFGVVIFAGMLGMAAGLLAGYYRRIDPVIMRICDSLKAVPSVILAIALMAVLGSDIRNVVIALTIVNIPEIARITRSATLVVRDQLYVEAIRASGASPVRIILHHVVPNVLSPVIVQISYVFATTIITEAALSFMGVGVPAPAPSWGNILNEGKNVIYKAWWMVVFPGSFTALSVLGLNLLGDGIRDLLDPRSE